jgi:hypothetical protein
MGITDWDNERLNVTEYSQQLFCTCSENTPWNSVRPCGLTSVELIENLTSASESEITQSPRFSEGPSVWLGVVFDEVFIK